MVPFGGKITISVILSTYATHFTLNNHNVMNCIIATEILSSSNVGILFIGGVDLR